LPVPDYLVRYVAPNYEKYRAWLSERPIGAVMFYYVYETHPEKFPSPELAMLAAKWGPPHRLRPSAARRRFARGRRMPSSELRAP
jgi:hypothetical protein